MVTISWKKTAIENI